MSPPREQRLKGERAYVDGRSANVDDYLAFYQGGDYGDFEAEFDFRWDAGQSGSGFIFRAQDTHHYYLAHIPVNGEVIRAEHFWACIYVVDGTGWAKVLRMEMLHGVPTEFPLWHTARLQVAGNEIRLWVDGRPLTPVHDDTYAGPGRVGLEAYGSREEMSTFRNVRLRGDRTEGTAWDPSVQPMQQWFLPLPVFETPWDPENSRSQQQRESGIVRTSQGHLLMNVGWMDDNRKQMLAYSKDDGRSWAPMDATGWPESYSGGSIHVRPDGRLLSVFVQGSDLMSIESLDGGETWSTALKARTSQFESPQAVPDMTLAGPGNFVQLKDGTLLGFQIGGVPGRDHESGHDLWEWGTHAYAGYSIRSTDGGKIWSAPVPLNGPPAVGQKYDLVECKSTTQTRNGKVLCLVRPVYSPWMWEVWSDNNGESWGPATSGPFPCYGATAFTTSLGVILVSGRMPGLGLYASHDDGMTWQAYQIDSGGLWAMGHMCEVAPGLVLYLYMDSYESLMRAQYLRVTESGVEPALEMLPDGR